MTENKKSNIWQTIGISVFVVLSLFFAYFTFNNSNSYKKEIKCLKHQIDSLNEVLAHTVDKDSIFYYLNEQERLDVLMSLLSEKIDSLNKIKYENPIDYSSISVDSNVIILSKRLSEDRPN